MSVALEVRPAAVGADLAVRKVYCRSDLASRGADWLSAVDRMTTARPILHQADSCVSGTGMQRGGFLCDEAKSPGPGFFLKSGDMRSCCSGCPRSHFNFDGGQTCGQFLSDVAVLSGLRNEDCKLPCRLRPSWGVGRGRAGQGLQAGHEDCVLHAEFKVVRLL